MRRTLVVGVLVLAVACAVEPTAQADPRGGGIVGTGTTDSGTFAINAIQLKNTRFSGTSSFQIRIGDVAGDVQYVAISGSGGCFSGAVTSSTISGIGPGQAYTVQVRDLTSVNPGPPSDQLQLAFGGIPNGCDIGIISPSGVTTGDIAVSTNVRPGK
jgi:hypothetical protein